MRKITLFVAAIAALALIGIETSMSVRTLNPGSTAPTLNPSVTKTGVKGSQYNDYLFVSD
jgi:hypothetical protein